MEHKYGRWTVGEKIYINGLIHYKCTCECGIEKIIYSQNLIKGKTKSCGCLKRELFQEKYKKTNCYEVDSKNNVVIGKTTNTGNSFCVDLDDFEKIKDISWYEAANGYITHKDRGEKVMFMHRIIMNAPENLVVDHINHNRMDNRKSNLRICTVQENSMNKKKIPKGISKVEKNGHVYYKIQLRGKYCGCFTDYEKAKARRDEIIKEYYL